MKCTQRWASTFEKRKTLRAVHQKTSSATGEKLRTYPQEAFVVYESPGDRFVQSVELLGVQFFKALLEYTNLLEFERPDEMAQKVGAFATRFEQSDSFLRKEDRDGDSRQPSATTYIHEVTRGPKELYHGYTVDQVASNHQLGISDRRQVQTLIPRYQV